MASLEEAAALAAAAEAEDYRVWKKNTPFLYSFLLSHALEWPSLTVHLLPSRRLLLGTHTSDSLPNHLLLASITPAAQLPTLTVPASLPHAGEVNRARAMPQNPALVATKSPTSDVYVFNTVNSTAAPEAVLRGHSAEGYGLAWSPHREMRLLSGSYDSRICLWDVGVGSLDAHQVFEAHTDAVEDVAWHERSEGVFGSVGDDRRLMVWDLRADGAGKPQHSVEAHEDEVNSLAFSPFNDWILATASADTTIKLFDLRKLTTSLHIFSGHNGPALQVEWSPKHETVFASSSDDKRLNVWDISRIGDEQNEEDAEDGPPELVFVHGGHTAKISEFSWSPDEPWVIASVAEDNILQVWQMAESIYRDDYTKQEDGDLDAMI